MKISSGGLGEALDSGKLLEMHMKNATSKGILSNAQKY